METMNLLERTKQLNEMAECSLIELGVLLAEVEEKEAYKEAGYDSFHEYYEEELGRNKSTVSQLVTVGRWIKEHSLLKQTEQTSYRKLYAAINLYQDKEPRFILAAAQTNTLHDLETERREKEHGICIDHQPITLCARCKIRIYES